MAVTLSNAAWPTNRSGRLGPFEMSDGSLVVIALSGGSLAYWRSTDGGSSWSQSASSIGASLVTLDAGRIGDSIYVAASTAAGAVGIYQVTPLAVTKFNVPVSPISIGNTDIAGNTPFFLAVRSVSRFVLLHQAAVVRVMGVDYRRVVWSECNGGTWNLNNAVDGGGTVNYDARGAVLGASSRVHFFYTRSDQISTLYGRTLTLANSLGAEQAVAATVSATVNYACGGPVLIGSDVAVPFASPGGFKSARAASADTPSWATTTVDGTAVDSTNSNPGALATDGTDLHAFYNDSSSSDLWHSEDTGSGWGSETEVQDAVTVLGVSAAGLSAANVIGYVFNDNGTVKYDAFSLGAPPVHLAAALAASAAVAAVLAVEKPLAASLSASLVLTPSLQDRKQLAAQLAAATALAAGLEVGKPLAALLSNSSSLASALLVGKPLSAQLDAASVLAGALAVEKPLAAQIAAAGLLSGDLHVSADVQLAAALAFSSALSGDLRDEKPLAADLASSAALSGSLSAEILLAAQLAAASTFAAALRDEKPLAAQLAFASALAGDLAVTQQTLLAAALAAAASMSGDLRDEKPLAAQLDAGLEVSADLLRVQGLAAQLAAASTASGALRVEHLLAAHIAALLTIDARLTAGAFLGAVGRRMLFGLGR